MQRFAVSRFVKLTVMALALVLFGHAPIAMGTTVVNMPAPPKVVKSQPARNVEADVQSPADVETWLDRAREADLAGTDRSYLGVVAITRYARARNSPRYTYYSNPYRYGYYGGYSHYGHYPFDVSFLHGVPINNCGFPWFGFHFKSSKWSFR